MARGGRLGRRSDIQRVFDEGASLRGARFVLRWVDNGLGEDRWAFAVGKRLAPGAVLRNRVRRRLREAVRRGRWGGQGRDIIVVAGRGALDATVAELEDELEGMMRGIEGRSGA